MLMNRWGRLLFSTLLGMAMLLPVRLPAQSNSDQDQGTKSAKEKKKDLKKLEKELATPYKKWLEEEVPYIISDQERAAFLQLSTNEEREQFIEAFWQRRDPTPDTVENEFKEEHYRRIAYANEHFAAGVAGWRTDRGRIYIIWGPPDEIEAHPTGGLYNRPMDEGGGQTTTYPYEDWRYRHMDGIGDNIIIEFVDTESSGNYHMTMDPGEKDALAKIPGAGLSMLEQMGMSSKMDRFNRTDGSTAPRSMLTNGNSNNNPARLDEFSRLEQFSKVQAPPPVKFKDLEEVVSSRILRNQISFDYRFDFLRITSESILVPITVQIQNKQMTFQDKDGVYAGTLNLFGRITTLSGRIVQTFEDVVRRDFPDSLLQQSLKGYSIYQKAVPLRPGLYKLDLVIKDVNSGNVGVVNTRLAVSPMPEDQLEASSLILADQIEPVAARDIGMGQFVIGSTKVRPKLDDKFQTDQPLGIYVQFYNLKVDDTTHKNDLSLEVKVTKGQQTVAHMEKTGEDLKQTGDQITYQQVIPAKSLPPGKYKLEIQATDRLTKQTVTRTADFTITPSAETSTAANTATGR
jgi:GWxTD domain-containing protein